MYSVVVCMSHRPCQELNICTFQKYADTAEDPDFRSIGVNKTTNLSKELQFFEKVSDAVCPYEQPAVTCERRGDQQCPLLYVSNQLIVITLVVKSSLSQLPAVSNSHFQLMITCAYYH